MPQDEEQTECCDAPGPDVLPVVDALPPVNENRPPNSWFARLRDRAMLEFLKWNQERALFSRQTPEPKIRAPQEYAKDPRYARLAEFHEEKLPGPHGRIGLWVRPPDDDSKPVYVIFHGRYGHWGFAGLDRDGTPEGYNRRYRLGILNALAESGAGVIAVHMRGHGLSRGAEPHVGERYFQADAETLAAYLQEKKIPGERVVVAGESMGGTPASMLALELTQRGAPPAELDMIVSFDSMREVAYQALVRTGRIHDTEENRRILQRVLRHPMDNGRRIAGLDPKRTRFHAVAVECDGAIPASEHAALMESARKAGLACSERCFTCEEVAPGQDNHTGYDPVVVAAEMNARFHAGRREIASESAEVAPYTSGLAAALMHVNGNHSVNGERQRTMPVANGVSVNGVHANGEKPGKNGHVEHDKDHPPRRAASR